MASPPPNGPLLAVAAGLPKNDDVEVAMDIPETPNAVELATLVGGASLLNGETGVVVVAAADGCCCGVVFPNNDGADVVGLPKTDVAAGLDAVGEPNTFAPGTFLNDCGLAVALPPKIEPGAVAVALEKIDVACEASLVLVSVALVAVVTAFPNIDDDDDEVVVAPPKTGDPPKIEPVAGVAPPKTLTIGALCGTEPKFSAPA